MNEVLSYRAMSIGATKGLCLFGAFIANLGADPAVAAAPEAGKWRPAWSVGDQFSKISADGAASVYEVKGTEALSERAELALGPAGLERLLSFRAVAPNWDGGGARSLDQRSVESMSEFFRVTGLRPPEMGVFMSREGLVVVNWEDRAGNLIELEFSADRIGFFLEDLGVEGAAPRTDAEVRRLAQKLKDSFA